MALYLVATPIGNLADITLRATELLRSCAYILCEDTRHSKILLMHYSIQRPLKSYHRFNEAAREQELLEDLRMGKEIALISDAGTPGIADPGERLVHCCISEGLPVVSLPGPCALIAALTSSGLNTGRFQFIGFLPRKASERTGLLLDSLRYPGTTICYEAPHRLLELLQEIDLLAPDRRIVVARELTKKFEEIRRGTARELLADWEVKAPRGEFVVLLSEAPQNSSENEWSHLDPAAHIQFVQEHYGLSRNEAIKWVAKVRGLNRRELYKRTQRTCDGPKWT